VETQLSPAGGCLMVELDHPRPPGPSARESQYQPASGSSQVCDLVISLHLLRLVVTSEIDIAKPPSIATPLGCTHRLRAVSAGFLFSRSFGGSPRSRLGANRSHATHDRLGKPGCTIGKPTASESSRGVADPAKAFSSLGGNRRPDPTPRISIERTFRLTGSAELEMRPAEPIK
jgi:hypothetical protein